MKIRLLLALVGLAISFSPTLFAQQKDTADPQTVQQRDLLGDAKALGEFGQLSLRLDAAINKNDAIVLAAFFTEDAVLVAPDGMFSGRRDIEKRYQDTFQRSPIIDFNSRRESHHLNAIDNAVLSGTMGVSSSKRRDRSDKGGRKEGRGR